MATRRAEGGLQFDHGAPVVAAREPAFAAELHAALVGVAELSKAGALPHPEWGFFGLLLVSFTVKTGIAWYAGGRDFAWRFGAAMLTALGVVAAVILLRG